MNIVVCGYGKAGKVLIKEIISSQEYELAGVLCRDDSKNADIDVGWLINEDKQELDFNITRISDAEENLKDANVDVIIDFSNRTLALPLLELCGKIKSNLVICTTNHSAEEIGRFEQLAEHKAFGVVYAPNLTIGINLMLDFVKKISNVFDGFKYEVIERHPGNKPMPTATARIIAEAIDQENIPIHSVRMDGYIGVHELIATDGIERIMIQHESLSRSAFAKGALTAAKFLKGKQGLYFMKDVISALDAE